jgi:hypothetical protein
MRQLSLSYKFYILFSLVLTVPASWIALKLGIYVNTLPTHNFFHYLLSVGVFEAPTTVIILFLFFWLFNNLLWKIPGVVDVLGIPNINGRYSGELVSSHTENKEQNGTYPVIIEIKQTLTTISVYLYTERSCSYSMIASLCKNYNNNHELVYVYQNKTSAMESDSDMRDHHGTAFLQVFEKGVSLTGNYFNNPRERGRYGKITVRRISRKRMGKF